MNNYLNIIYLVVFLTMIIISTKIILASNYEKLFKQGKIVEIRVAFFIMVITISFITTMALVKTSEVIYNLISK
ncbi:MAG: hypothetical protein SOZ32_00965 [Bacilli bacterium]|nr:hypothetical protein [Mollicutes bacterium]MDY3898772.1 hypothetical protein [Bacilli bacterium]